MRSRVFDHFIVTRDRRRQATRCVPRISSFRERCDRSGGRQDACPVLDHFVRVIRDRDTGQDAPAFRSFCPEVIRDLHIGRGPARYAVRISIILY
ncbi:hypothetical protein FNV43_RR15904 [Rhamnella rubrinervis]|uniref:Uncharacterized protein n=1 Tax=Rhamnella rubrinervis TaxID=2594499 RepID=A0A8K0GXP7_9ROSA|nr:hypothetical protein FNV43_RR15904 [Rhamnella rubrinervis]